jgi:hypothetical protein
MVHLSRVLSAFVLLAWGASAEPLPALRIAGAPNGRAAITAEDLAKVARVKAAATDHDGTKAVYEGWPLGEVLALAGVPRGKDFRGPSLAASVTASAADGYRVVFALAELEPSVTDKVVLLADRRDGKPLPPSEGSWRIVVPSEKRPARWIRGVVSLEIVRPGGEGR